MRFFEKLLVEKELFMILAMSKYTLTSSPKNNNIVF